MANGGDIIIVGEVVPLTSKSGNYQLIVTSEGVAAIASAGKPAKTTLPKMYVVNLFLAGGLGFVALIWFAAYTEHVTALQTLLGLGGLFVWFTFLSNAISAERKAALQTWLDDALNSSAGTVVIVLLFCAFALYATHYAAIVAVGRNDSTARLITVRRVFADGRLTEPLASDALPANGLLRMTVPASFFLRRYRIFATGLPATDRDLHVFSRAEVVLPTDFQQRPVALLHLSALDTANAAQNHTDTRLRVIVWRNDHEIATTTVPNYDGRSVWVGCDSSVQIPAPIRARWPKEADVLWSDPIAILPNTLLERGDAISARLENGSGSCIAIIPRITLRPIQYELNVAEIMMDRCSD
jgi:hypothetical protein